MLIMQLEACNSRWCPWDESLDPQRSGYIFWWLKSGSTCASKSTSSDTTLWSPCPHQATLTWSRLCPLKFIFFSTSKPLSCWDVPRIQVAQGRAGGPQAGSEADASHFRGQFWKLHTLEQWSHPPFGAVTARCRADRAWCTGIDSSSLTELRFFSNFSVHIAQMATIYGYFSPFEAGLDFVAEFSNANFHAWAIQEYCERQMLYPFRSKWFALCLACLWLLWFLVSKYVTPWKFNKECNTLVFKQVQKRFHYWIWYFLGL